MVTFSRRHAVAAVAFFAMHAPAAQQRARRAFARRGESMPVVGNARQQKAAGGRHARACGRCAAAAGAAGEAMLLPRMPQSARAAYHAGDADEGIREHDNKEAGETER